MKIGNFEIVRSKAVSFSWFWHRLTLKQNPPIYHWLWFTYGLHERPTKHAPDEVESAASVIISPTSEVSSSEADSTPTTTQVM